MPSKKSKKFQKSELTGASDPLEKILHAYVDEFIANNRAAKVVADGLRVIGVGFRPLIDHLTFRTLDVDERSKEFLKYGYTHDTSLGVIEEEHWWAKIYRKPGYPTLFIDQPFSGEKGKGSPIPDWVAAFGDKNLHHAAILVDDIQNAVFFLEKQGVAMAGNIIGDPGSDLRQILTQPEIRNGKIFTALELIERHRGVTGFMPPESAEGFIQPPVRFR